MNGELLFNSIVLILQDEKSSEDWLPNNVNTLNATNLNT